jgi:hypothetical protein
MRDASLSCLYNPTLKNGLQRIRVFDYEACIGASAISQRPHDVRLAAHRGYSTVRLPVYL